MAVSVRISGCMIGKVRLRIPDTVRYKGEGTHSGGFVTQNS